MKNKKILILLIAAVVTGCQASSSKPDYELGLSSINQYNTRSDTALLDNSYTLKTQDADLWKSIRSGLSIPIPHNSHVEHEKQKLLKHKDALYNMAYKAEPYMYWIIEQLKRRKMPVELVLLPIVESDFNPHATSHAQAAGLWQIIPRTGLSYGLKQNKWYDGRRDVAASTDAALNILKRLNQVFKGDWLLTIAAYNSGEGRVLRAIKENQEKQLPTDFWSLSLPQETARYIPKMLALAEIIQHSQKYGIRLPKPDTKRALTLIEVHHQLKLSQAAHMAGIPLSTMKAFNPGYLRNVTIPNSHGLQYIMLPEAHLSRFEKALAYLKKQRQYEKENTYIVRAGDTLSGIAERMGVTQKELKQVNNLTSSTILKIGQPIQLHPKNAIEHLQIHHSQHNHHSQQRLTAKKDVYIVRTGDTLSSIAEQLGVTLKELEKANNLTSKSILKAGQPIVVLSKNTTKNLHVHTNQYNKTLKEEIYIVRTGDTISSIAEQFGLTQKELEKTNRLTAASILKIGQAIIIQS